MTSLKYVIDVLSSGLSVKQRNVEMLDLRHVLDQYSDHPHPVIQVITTQVRHVQVDKTYGAATAGCDHVTIKTFSSYEDALNEFQRLLK